MIVSAGHDERGAYRNGTAGDQTGTEYYVRAWYKRNSKDTKAGWDYVLRYPDAKVGQKIADIAMSAAANNKIGYDMNQRLTFYNQLKAVGWDPSKITVACETDCSASTAATVIAAGHHMGLSKLASVNPSCTTHNLRAALVAAGFKVYSSATYCGSDAYLLPGDIILNEAHHVVINVSTGSKATQPTSQGVKSVAQYAGIVKVSDYLNVRTGPASTYPNVTLGDDKMKLPNGMVVSIDAESNGWGRLTGTTGWVSLTYIKH